MVRPTAHLLVLVMLLASGRLLACGWECADELAVPVEASCHEDSPTDRQGLPIAALANAGDTMHACLPEVAEPRVRVAKPASGQWLESAPLFATLVVPNPTAGSVSDRRHPRRPRFASPHLPGFSILRV